MPSIWRRWCRQVRHGMSDDWRFANYTPFVLYRIALGLLLLVLIYGFGWTPTDGHM